jgi:hypothetical protein
VIHVKEAGPVTITVTTKDPTALQELTGYSRQTKLGRLAAMNGVKRKRVGMNEICNQWVDYFRRVPLSTFRKNDTPANARNRQREVERAKRFNRVQGTGAVDED